ncbi:MAG TPA: hypothetical protein VHT21_07535 [Stellaceae bacterium]|nr:hypothetical protein [Stellaceae bacterium]
MSEEEKKQIGELLRELQAREHSTTGDRDVDKVDRRFYRALHQLLFAMTVPSSPVQEDDINDGELRRALEPLEQLAAESRFRAVAKEIGLSRSIKQLRVLFGSAAVKSEVARKGAAPRDPTAYLNIWIVIETAKHAKNLKTLSACQLLRKLGGLSVKKDTVKAPSVRKLDSVNSMRRRHSEGSKTISGNFLLKMFAEACVWQSLQEWQESGIPYEAWERKRLAALTRGAPIVRGNYPILLPT